MKLENTSGSLANDLISILRQFGSGKEKINYLKVQTDVPIFTI
jgi:hypothetical protein